MRYARIFLAVLAVGALAAGPLAGAAGARLLAPTYQSSDPEDGEMMDHPPSEVTATFSEPLDPSSQMSVFDDCGTEIDSGPATVSVNEMSVGIAKTPAGTYKVVYTAVGVAGVTGRTNGSFDFMVHHGSPCKKGGRGGHGDHGKGKGKGKDKGGHGNHGGGDDDHDDHDGMGSGSGHSGTHPSSSGTHPSGHSSDSKQGGGHMGSGGSGHGNGHGDHGAEPGPRGGGGTTENPNPPVASGPGGGAAMADVQAMLVGLGLALLVGVLGGWLLRNSGGLPAGLRSRGS